MAKALKAQREQVGATDVQGRLQTLTVREAQVFALVVTGMLNKQIAADLGLSVKTVETHRSRMMETLGCRNSVELLRMAMRLHDRR